MEATMHILDWGRPNALESLPEDLSLAFIGETTVGQITRLTESTWAYRASAGTGPWFIGSFAEITDIICKMPAAKPYVPRGTPDKNPYTNLTIDLKLEFL
jgi:hypothetical protein